MAESVDALVSNTSGATRAGSTPALGTSVQNLRKQVLQIIRPAALFLIGKPLLHIEFHTDGETQDITYRHILSLEQRTDIEVACADFIKQ